MGRPTNSSKVAILTGLGRREVAKQREMLAAVDQREPTYLNSATRVLSGWHQDADYLDSDGHPRDIPAVGPPPSFEDLCRRYGGDIPYSALLKELRAVGAVSRGDDAAVRALSRVYIPLQVDPAKVLRAGSVLQDIGTTVVHDLTVTPKQTLRFERRAANDRIAARHEAAFRAFLEAEGQAFLERADEWLTRHEATEQVNRRTVRHFASVSASITCNQRSNQESRHESEPSHCQFTVVFDAVAGRRVRRRWRCG